MFYFKRSSLLHYILSIIFSLLAWLGYESTWILPAVMIAVSLADMRTSNSKWRDERRYILAIIIAFLVYLGLRFYFTGAVTGLYEISGVEHFGFFFLVNNFVRLGIRSWVPPSHVQLILTVTAIIVTGLIVLSIIKASCNKRKTSLITLLVLWLISLLPYVTLGVDTKGVESERYLYLPSLFICIFIVLAIARFSSRLAIPLLIIICSVNIVFLAGHTREYRFAGKVNKMTITELQKMENKKTIFAIDVPQSQYGALLFRRGLPEAVNWLVDKKSVDTLIVVSKLSPDVLKDNYHVSYSNDPSFYSKDISLKVTGGDIGFLKFTDSVLYIAK